MSGPAALKLSAFAARVLNEGGYRGKLVVNWLAGNNPSRVSRGCLLSLFLSMLMLLGFRLYYFVDVIKQIRNMSKVLTR